MFLPELDFPLSARCMLRYLQWLGFTSRHRHPPLRPQHSLSRVDKRLVLCSNDLKSPWLGTVNMACSPASSSLDPCPNNQMDCYALACVTGPDVKLTTSLISCRQGWRSHTKTEFPNCPYSAHSVLISYLLVWNKTEPLYDSPEFPSNLDSLWYHHVV